MNILNELTIKNLKLNKKRTIVTIIGILLSVALICAVAGMVSSFQATLIDYAIKDSGNRHITIEDVDVNDLKYFTNNSHVKSMFLTENLGYAKVMDFNENKPYAYVLAYTKDAFANTTIELLSGRLPQDKNEIVISSPYQLGSKLNVGDIISLDIGKRVCEDGSKLNQSNPYYIEEGEEDTCHEKIIDTTTHEYKIVGIMERPNYDLESYSAPGYTMITYTDSVTNNINVSLLFKDVKYYKDYVKNIQNDNDLNKYNITYNNDLLRWTGASLSDRSMSVLITVAGVIIAIIVFTSVFVIKNSFDIANQEKRKMYGMLSSIGATSKQIKKNVLHEGFILGVIGIPLGILLGVFADYILVIIINVLGSSLFENLKFVFSISVWPIIISIIMGSLTIYLSVVTAAKKSSKIAPIEAIRNNNEIKINKKNVKSSKIVNKLFGVGGDIAYKNLKRNKKRNRTTIISIVLSVAVFISLSSFINYGFKITGQYYVDLNYSLQVFINEEDTNKINKAYEDLSKMDTVLGSSLNRSLFMDFDATKYYNEEALKYVATDGLLVRIMAVGKEEFARLLEENNVKSDNYNFKGLLMDTILAYTKNENYKEINLIDLNKNKTITGTFNDRHLSIDIIKRITTFPMGMQSVYSDAPILIVTDDFFDYIVNNYDSSEDVNRGTIYIKSSNAEKLELEIKDYMVSSDISLYNIYNVESEAEAQRSVIILVSIFLYGFIIVISLIGITNIINTITTNMNLRKREMAMLKSIGMTKKEFNKMINLESIMYSTKSLIIGVPLGLIGSFLIYKAFAKGNDYGYIFPWQAILIAVIVVYILVSLIMYFALRKTRKENIIDTIKDENI